MSLYLFVSDYFEKRGIPYLATGKDALLFLQTEVGELVDAHMRTEPEWVRNTQDKDVSVADEVADVLMMLVAYAGSQGLDPEECLKNKIRRKLNK